MRAVSLHLARDRRRAPLAPLAPSLTSTARHGWRWTLSRRCSSAPACFIFKPASAAVGHRRQVTLRCLVGGVPAELGGDAGSPISAHQLPKEPACRSHAAHQRQGERRRPASDPAGCGPDLRCRPADREGDHPRRMNLMDQLTQGLGLPFRTGCSPVNSTTSRSAAALFQR